MRSNRTSPAVIALLLALGADAKVGLDQSIKGAPNNILFPDVLTSGSARWGDSGGNNVAAAASILVASDSSLFKDYSAYTGGQGSCVDCIRSQ